MSKTPRRMTQEEYASYLCLSDFYDMQGTRHRLLVDPRWYHLTQRAIEQAASLLEMAVRNLEIPYPTTEEQIRGRATRALQQIRDALEEIEFVRSPI